MPPREAGRVVAANAATGWGFSLCYATPPGLAALGHPPPAGEGLDNYRIPARMKLCTNWRWNSKNPSSNGADVIRVAAQMTAQSMP